MSVNIDDIMRTLANSDIASKGEYGGVVTTIMKHLLERRYC